MSAIQTQHRYRVDLDNCPLEVELPRPLMHTDALCDEFILAVRRGMTPVVLTGMNVLGCLTNADHQTLPLSGRISGFSASVTFPDAAYATPGPFTLTIQLRNGDVRHTILRLKGEILRTSTDTLISSGDLLPTLPELLEDISGMYAAAEEARNAANEADAAADRVQKTLDNTLAAMENTLTDNAPAIVVESSGEPLLITDGADRPAVHAVSVITPIQAGSGTPSPQNIRPVIGQSAVTFCHSGTNILDVATCEISTNQVHSSPTYSLERTATGVKMTLVKDTSDSWVRALIYLGTREELLGKTITAAAEYTTTASGNAANMVLASADVRDGYLDAHTAFTTPTQGLTRCTGTVPDDAKAYIYLVLYLGYGFNGSSGDTVEWSSIRVSFGSSVPQWQPAHRTTLSATLPETVYGGTLDWVTGLLTVDHRCITLTGSESWYYNGTQFVMSLGKPGTNKTGFCSHYKYQIAGQAAAMYVDGQYLAAGYGISNKFATTADWKAWLSEQHTSGTPVQVVYPVAEPYTIQLTPHQLNLLKGHNSLWGSCGSTHLTYIADTRLYIDNAIASLASGILNA